MQSSILAQEYQDTRAPLRKLLREKLNYLKKALTGGAQLLELRTLNSKRTLYDMAVSVLHTSVLQKSTIGA